ncbi:MULTISPECIES: DNA (cytosine-5-)-methyltransferase [unclassified Dolichospermum]|uniref:DNA (cytosine-5-)-methyltransferase n=1 Tax=unclassified Dolichospermum TaxID=2622029 RepID=UPI00144721AE|nr:MULTISPECIES: DNA (cytosine-5-)-methyltransferase [unclassified Dolichospermum]MTJ18616.1 DNA (cytosine-5-)-methyltransferase [Dolichospermum sp. UHCC 0299]MTJ39402.1 DNA (cytosine-5-)-methyltransferase [Dolichospermum sp. UHCC 0406]
MSTTIKFIDLFAGIGGMRLGLEKACKSLGIHSECVLTSEIKSTAIKVYQQNFNEDKIWGDITEISSQKIPDFDILLAGFPCQPFSSAGTRQGFLDTRGTLFFEIERILKDKSPFGFLLENVEGLVQHDDGRTLTTIINKLEQLGYQVKCDVLNARDFGVPQDRKRVYITGTKTNPISLNFPRNNKSVLLNILETGCPTLQTNFVKKLLAQYSLDELYGKSIRDKRGGEDNIHSWDLELKGNVSREQRELLNLLLKQRRRKNWSAKKGIQWMDGIPLSLDEIETFYQHKNLKQILDDLANKGYLKYEHPKDIQEVVNKDGKTVKKREYRLDLPKGYNIVVGKLSFPINKILDPHDISPTLVATDMQRLAVVDGKGLRCLTIREGLRLFGFPEDYHINLPINKAFDLLGNTVVVTVVREISERIVIQKMLSVPNKVYVLTR